MRITEIPLSPQAQRFKIALAGTLYSLRLTWSIADGGFWVLDIGSGDGATPILCGIALVTGSDLLAQHRHLGLGGALIVKTDRNASEVPTYAGLGTTSRLYFVVP